MTIVKLGSAAERELLRGLAIGGGIGASVVGGASLLGNLGRRPVRTPQGKRQETSSEYHSRLIRKVGRGLLLGGSVGAAVGGMAASAAQDARLARTKVTASGGGSNATRMGSGSQKSRSHWDEYEKTKREYEDFQKRWSRQQHNSQQHNQQHNQQHSNKDGWEKDYEDFQKKWDDFAKRQHEKRNSSGHGQYTPPPPPRPKTNGYHHSDFFKNYAGADHTKIKTKKEAKAYYRAAAQKHHPDAGGSAEAFKKMQAQWEDVENSDWFVKLSAYNSSIIKLAMYHMQ